MEFANIAYAQKCVRRTPIVGENVYIVRIAQKSVNANKDHKRLKKQLISGEEAIWDSVKGNKVKVGDWMGFILGDTHSAQVELYQVSKIKGSECRPSYWARSKYTDQNVTENVDNREVVVFVQREPLLHGWEDWKELVNYKPKYMPRGTSKARYPW